MFVFMFVSMYCVCIYICTRVSGRFAALYSRAVWPSAPLPLTMIKISWNSGNLPYLVANKYGFNFIKIGGISTFHGEGGPPCLFVAPYKN